MTALSHRHEPLGGLPAAAELWWSPLSELEAREALLGIGAQGTQVPLDGGALYVLAPGTDVFCPALCVSLESEKRGTLVSLRTERVGFGRDFPRAVRAGLAAFAALIWIQVALKTEGDRFLELSAAVLLVWAIFMGLFALLQALLVTSRPDLEALSRARIDARRVLFARRV